MTTKTNRSVFHRHSDEAIRAAIDMCRKEAEALELALEGCSIQELSAAIGQSQSTTYQHLQAAIRAAERMAAGKRAEEKAAVNQDMVEDLPYPENLFCAITGYFPGDGKVYADWRVGLEYAVGLLPQESQDMLSCVFREKTSLLDWGKKQGFHRTKVLGIYRDTMRELRHPSKLRYFTKGYEAEKARDEYNRKLMELSQEQVKADLKEKFTQEELNQLFNMYLSAHRNRWSLRDVSVEELNLSQRSYIALRRSKIDTLADIFKAGMEGLYSLPGVGAAIEADVLAGLFHYLNEISFNSIPDDMPHPALND